MAVVWHLRTAVLVDGRFEHIVLSCNATSEHAIIWIEREAQRALNSGYERLCFLRCIQPRDHNYGTTCVCRVPKHLREEKVVECVHCGCQGCVSSD